LEKKAFCRLLSGSVGEKSSLSSYFRSRWRKNQPVVFFPVLLEKKAACPFLSGSFGEKK
jgi:hypothetical protein